MGIAGKEKRTIPSIRYRPRIEGLFARIERWVDQESRITHWRIISRENVKTIYGLNPESRIADPEDEKRIFRWLITCRFDDKGNFILYDYKGGRFCKCTRPFSGEEPN